MTIEFPSELESALKAEANAHGISVASYVREVVERELASSSPPSAPFKTGYGILGAFGNAPSAEEIDRNRIEMFGQFAERF